MKSVLPLEVSSACSCHVLYQHVISDSYLRSSLPFDDSLKYPQLPVQTSSSTVDISFLALYTLLVGVHAFFRFLLRAAYYLPGLDLLELSDFLLVTRDPEPYLTAEVTMRSLSKSSWFSDAVRKPIP